MSESLHVADEPLGAIEGEWGSLAGRLGLSPFLGPAWFATWGTAFGGPVYARTIRLGGELVGVLPLVRRRGVTRSPTNWHTPVYGPIADRAAETEVMPTLLGSLSDEDPRRIDLSFVDSEDYARWGEGLPRSYDYSVRVLLSSPYLRIEGAWEDYWAGRSKNLRGAVRRCRNRLADLGEVRLEVYDGSEGDRYELLDAGFALEATGWKADRGTAVAAALDVRQFYYELADRAAAEGILRLAFLNVGDRPVAFNYCLESGGRHYLVKLGHDEELRHAGPGTVLTAAMLERCFEMGLSGYEFLGAAEAYKLRWASDTRERLQIQGFRSGTTGSIDRMLQTQAKGAVRGLRSRLRGDG